MAQPGPPGFHVDRGVFDRLLLQNAVEKGVQVVKPAQTTNLARLSDGSWRISIRHQGKPQEVISRFLVDASGAGNVLRSRRKEASAPLLALYAQWDGIDNKELSGRVEAGEEEWFWYAPLGCGRSIIAVFLDPKRLSTMRPESLASTYERLLQRFSLLRERRQGRIESAVRACDASSRYAEEPVGPGFVKIGDAAFTLDPLSSQGVQSAIASALQAAIVVNTFAKYPANLEAATEFYRDRQREKVEQHVRKAALEYRKRAVVCNQPFWLQRSIAASAPTAMPHEEEELEATCRLHVSHRATIESTPVIQGDAVVSKLTVNNETLGRPVAFVSGVEIVPLLTQITSGQTAEAIVANWSQELSSELSWKIMHWLWSRRIVTPINSGQD
jgi:flavin-dependent dehydrogenase